MPTGRHRTADSSRRLRVAPSLILTLLVVVVLTVVGTGYAVFAAQSGCSGTIDLTVVTGPSEQPLLSYLANQWGDGSPSVKGHCVNLSVDSKTSPDTAAALSPRWDARRDGPRPDVWAPEATTWVRLAQLRADAVKLLPRSQPSIMRSPVVIAMPRPMATALSWPLTQLSWQQLVTDMGTRSLWKQHGHASWGEPRLGMSNPAKDTAGLAALLAVDDDDGDGVIGTPELSRALSFRREVTTYASTTSGLLAGLQKSTKADKPLAYLSAFPALEQDVSSYNQTAPANARLAAFYPSDGAPEATFPYLTLNAPWLTADKRAAATAFLNYLHTGPVQRSLQAQGYRSYTGVASQKLSINEGLLANIPNPNRPLQQAQIVGRTLATWTGLSQVTNTLMVLDTSGSMADAVAAGGRTKLQVAQQATRRVLLLFGDRSDFSLWSFSAPHDGQPEARRVLVADGPLSQAVGNGTRRTAVQAQIDDLRSDGGTALFSTVLAAYSSALANYQSGRPNAVILLTDGRNKDSGDSVTQAATLSRLAAMQDKAKPIEFLTIAYGAGADVTALQAISRVTGGRTFVSSNPTDLEQVYLSALVSS